MLNLMKVLTDKDKELLTAYLTHYSQAGKYYCGNDIFLREWAKNKKGLYQLLGGQLKRSIPFCATKDKYLIRKEIVHLIDNTYNFFRNDLWNLLYDEEELLGINLAKELISYDAILIPIENNTPVSYKIKYKAPNAKKMLQINEGCSPVKALGKIVNYLWDNFPVIKNKYPDLLNKYEDFRQRHSLILNDKELKGNLVLSIHPLDFLTMSNNSLGWQSCMKWELSEDINESGCYHAGTIEMMNSNNVICCYLESKIPYEFYKNEQTGEVSLWNNKRWRNLFIVTPEIICSGKAYPYQHEGMCHAILNELKDLAKKNKKWTYSFGIEKYRDMKNISNMEDMNRVRRWMNSGNGKKHSIIFDTSGMYNDFLNDGSNNYYCYRNKVKKEIIIRYSGKALCTCCGDQYIFNEDRYEDCWDDYNERFGDITGFDICQDCLDVIPKCDNCGAVDTPDKENVRVIDNERICYKCFTYQYNKCPECGSVYHKSRVSNHRDYLYVAKEKNQEIENEYSGWGLDVKFNLYNVCPDCTTKTINNTYGLAKPLKIRYGGIPNYYYLPYTEDKKIQERFSSIEPTKEDFMKATKAIEAE